jgi:putative transport protein
MHRCGNWTCHWELWVARGSPRNGGCFVCRNLLWAAWNANRRTDSGIRPDFGLILFVYTIGLQVGPGFFSSLKSQGLQLNALAAGVVLLGGLIAACLGLVFRFSIPAVAGIFSGATTNTPSLAAAQAVLQNLKDQPSANADLLGMAYAVAYPFGIIGIILTMLFIKMVFHIDAETDRIDDRAVKDFAAELQITLTWR